MAMERSLCQAVIPSQIMYVKNGIVDGNGGHGVHLDIASTLGQSNKRILYLYQVWCIFGIFVQK